MTSGTATTDDLTSTEPTTVEKLRGLPWSIASNAANTVFVQFTYFGSVFILFLSTLGLSKTEMGFVLSLMPYCGLIALFVAPAVARHGYKRTYILFFGLRAVVTALLLFTPWVMAQFGATLTFWYVAGIVSLFSILRAVGVTGNFPWIQEYVPNNVRGKYTATNNVFTTLVGFLAVSAGGFVLAHTAGLTGFMLLIATGVIFGLASVWLAVFIPGGAPVPPEEAAKQGHRDLSAAVHDGQFLRYLAGSGLIVLATTPLGSFLPLFMGEQVGLTQSQVVLLQSGSLFGSLLSSYGWGWFADRYGSRPVIFSGLAQLAALPVLWLLMPRNSPASAAIALFIAFLQGTANMGWGIGSARLLYVNIVPPAKKADYMALYFAWVGVVGGTSQLIAGRLLDITDSLSAQFALLAQNPYLPIFAAAFFFPLLTLFIMRRIREESPVSVTQFAGIFFRGNPFLAMTSMVRYHLAHDERSAVRMTERLGQARSLLTVDELLDALEDPRFNVRFEAVLAIARMQPEPRLTQALVNLLDGSELALTAVATWALGRMGGPQAVEPLRGALNSSYRSIRAHSARALGALGDTEIAPVLLDRLHDEPDPGLRMAYASALGNLRTTEAADELLDLLRVTDNQGARLELALTLARLTGDEHSFIQLVRQVREDAGTAMSRSISSLKRTAARVHTDSPALVAAIDACADALAHGDLNRGVAYLADIIRTAPPKDAGSPAGRILQGCAREFDAHGAQRPEYVMLALHVLHTGWEA